MPYPRTVGLLLTQSGYSRRSASKAELNRTSRRINHLLVSESTGSATTLGLRRTIRHQAIRKPNLIGLGFDGSYNARINPILSQNIRVPIGWFAP